MQGRITGLQLAYYLQIGAKPEFRGFAPFVHASLGSEPMLFTSIVSFKRDDVVYVRSMQAWLSLLTISSIHSTVSMRVGASYLYTLLKWMDIQLRILH